MAVRGDYISLWWPGAPIDPDHFWSKPVLSFWIMSLSLLAVRARRTRRPGRWRCRRAPSGRCALPFCLFGVLGIYAVYLCVSRFVSRRAGVMAAVVTATSPLYALVSRQAMTDMAFVGPMTMALALGALALFDDEDVPLPRREARIGRRKLTWPRPPAVLPGDRRCSLVVALPQLVIDSLQLEWTFTVGGHAVTIPGVVVMLPYIAGFVAYFAARRPRPLQGAALPQHRGDAVRPGDAGQGARRPGPAGAGVPGVPRASPGTGSASTARSSAFAILIALLTCAVVAIPWHHAMLIRHGRAVLGRALRRQPLAPAGRRPPRRSRHLRVLRARARLRGAALDRARAGRAGRGGDAPGAAASRRAGASTPPRSAARASSGSARSGSSPATRWCRCRSPSSTTTSCPRSRAWRSRSAASSTTCSTRRDGRAARGGRDRGHPAAGAGAGRSGRRAEERAALHLAVLVRLHQLARRAALAARRSTSGAG